MIQRIQSLYLLIATVLLFLVFCFPFSVLHDANGGIYSLVYNGLKQQTSNGWLQIKINYLSLLALLFTNTVTFFAIFMHKNRKLQMKFCWISIVSAFLLFASFFIRHWQTLSELNISNSNFSVSAILPLISAILTYMALKAIKKDDDMVKSIDRIR